MDILVRQAIEAAEQRHPDGMWFEMAPKERSAAIYDELRRLDGENSKKSAAFSKSATFSWKSRRVIRSTAKSKSSAQALALP